MGIAEMDKASRCRRRVIVALGAWLGLAGGVLAQQTPGAKPGEPAPGQPEQPKPDFVMPAPNRGAEPPAPAPTPEQAGAQPGGPKAGPPVQAPGAADPEAPAYLVGAFVIRYALDHPSLPAIDDLLKHEVRLGHTDAGYVAPGGGVPEETFAIEDVSLRPPERWTSRALYIVEKGILEEMNKSGVIGVTVTPIEAEFAAPGPGDPQWGKDLRKPGQTAVTLLVRVGLVTEIRSLAFGDRIPFERRINAKEHQKILENAPVQVYQPDEAGDRRDVLRKDLLDDYVFRLNRLPGRRVDLAVAAAEQEGGIALDLLINENKPWLAYAQVSNTGTSSTSEWRERVGYVNNQLTGHDDILSLDFSTAAFDSSNAVVASYERPIWTDAVRMKVFGNWNNFTASDVGLAGEKFKGDGYAFGGELIANVYQHRELFVDVFAGVRFQHVHVNNEAVDISGATDFFLPSVGARLERNTDTSSTNASLTVEWNLPSVAGTSQTELQKLGRLDVTDEWTSIQWDLAHSFYLDPYYYGARWNDTGPNGKPTLAHELALSFRGQHAIDKRLTPNFEQVVGGMYTVRGYPESVVAGDTVLVASAEYRVHVPQLLGYDPNPGTLFGQTFRWKAQQPYGRADWDLVLKGFVDGGRTINSHRKSYESDSTLVGTGVGAEFFYKRNLSIRVDWGVALESIKNEVKSGSNRVHFMATILF